MIDLFLLYKDFMVSMFKVEIWAFKPSNLVCICITKHGLSVGEM